MFVELTPCVKANRLYCLFILFAPDANPISRRREEKSLCQEKSEIV